MYAFLRIEIFNITQYLPAVIMLFKTNFSAQFKCINIRVRVRNVVKNVNEANIYYAVIGMQLAWMIRRSTDAY